MKKGFVYKKDAFAGIIWEDENGYQFEYDKNYLENAKYGAISKTLPLRKEKYLSENMLPFFDGLIPEGWLLEIAIDNWKLDPRDRMNLLTKLCKNNIGDISILKNKKDD